MLRLAAVIAVLLAFVAAPTGSSAPTTELVSVGSTGENALGFAPAVSATGRYVAFELHQMNPDDTNGVADVYVRDRVLAQTVRVSIASNGSQANDFSYGADISDSGRFVTFVSWASNLVPADSNALPDVFIHDRDVDRDSAFDEPGAVRTSRISVTTRGSETHPHQILNFNELGAVISGRGRFVAFNSPAADVVTGDTNGVSDVFVRDRDTDRDGIFDEPGAVLTMRGTMSARNRQSNSPTFGFDLSSRGRFLAFSARTALVSADRNQRADIYVRDLDPNRDGKLNVDRVAVARISGRRPLDAPRLSASGRYLTAQSSYLHPRMFVHDRDADSDGRFDEPGATRTTVSRDERICPRLSHSGRFAIVNTYNGTGYGDILVFDLRRQAHRLVNVATDGDPADGPSETCTATISGNGRFVAFDSQAGNLTPTDSTSDTDVFIRGPYRWR